MSTSLNTFVSIMVFYIILSYVVFPLAFYYLVEKSLSSAGNGFILGSAVSVMLWLVYGKKMVH